MKVKRPRCTFCSKEAVVSLPYARLRLCEDHFEEFLIKRIRRVPLPKSITVGLSGGKDSVAMTYLLKKAGIDVKAITVDTVPEYTSREAEIAREFAETINVEHITVYPKELYGFNALHFKFLKRKPCSLCSTLRRHALDLVTKRLGLKYVATGHNADDMASLALSSLMKQDLETMRKVRPVEEAYGPFVGRVKPLFWVPERDILAFVLTKRLPWIKASCPLYTQGSTFSDKIKEFLNTMEDSWPGIKINLLKAVQRLIGGEEKRNANVCRYCGLAAWGEVCSVCKLRQKYKGKLPDVEPKRPKYSCAGEGDLTIVGVGWCKRVNVDVRWIRVDRLLNAVGLNKETAVAYDVNRGKPLPYDAWIGSWNKNELMIFAIPRISPI